MQRSPNKDIKEDLKCMFKCSLTLNRGKKVLLENLVVTNDANKKPPKAEN